MKKFALSLLLSAALAVPAHAGEVTATDAQVNWRSTQCQQPVAPQYAAPSAASGSVLNANMEAYQNYTRAVQAYLSCLSNEAAQDMQRITAQMNAQLQQVQTAWQADLTKQQQLMQGMTGR